MKKKELKIDPKNIKVGQNKKKILLVVHRNNKMLYDQNERRSNLELFLFYFIFFQNFGSCEPTHMSVGPSSVLPLSNTTHILAVASFTACASGELFPFS